MKNNKGFSLIELIVVITILAILGTISYISAKSQSLEANISRMEFEEYIFDTKDKKCYEQGEKYICDYPAINLRCKLGKDFNYNCSKIDNNILNNKDICRLLGGEENIDYIDFRIVKNCEFVLNKGTFDFKKKKILYSDLKYIYNNGDYVKN